MRMEAWLAELEMEWNGESLINYNTEKSGTAMVTFGEDLAGLLRDDMPCTLSSESNTSPLEVDYLDYEYQSNSPISADTNNNKVEQVSLSPPNHVLDNNDDVTKSKIDDGKDTKEQVGSGRQKRKRAPSQVHDHIMAERKRRELLTQRFIALSAIVPGLKKMDKTSVLGEAIIYLQQLQDKVKTLEEITARQTVKSVVVVKKSQIVVDNDDGVDDNDSSCSVTGRGDGSGEKNNSTSDRLPEIEVKVSHKTLLLRVYCEKQKGLIAKILTEVEKRDMSVVNCTVMPFGSLALDITVVAQMEKGFNTNAKDLIRSLHAII